MQIVPIREHQKEEIKEKIYFRSLPQLRTHTVTISILYKICLWSTSTQKQSCLPTPFSLPIPPSPSRILKTYLHKVQSMEENFRTVPHVCLREEISLLQDNPPFKIQQCSEGNFPPLELKFLSFLMARLCVGHSY
jgi:hypothetical protein